MAVQPLRVYGDPARLRDGVRRLIRRGQELLAEGDSVRGITAAARSSAPGHARLGTYNFTACGAAEELRRATVTWERAVRRTLSRQLSDQADRVLVHKWVNPWLRGDQADEVVEYIDSHITARLGELRSVLSRLPTHSNQHPRGPTPFNELRASGLVEEVQLDAYLKRMTTVRTQPQVSAAIGAAKELVEATLRGALASVSPNTAASHDFPKLAKQVRTELHAHLAQAGQALAADATAQMISGFVSIETGLASLRNDVGSGHGKAKLPASLARRHAWLAQDVACAYTRYLVLTLVDARVITLLPAG